MPDDGTAGPPVYATPEQLRTYLKLEPTDEFDAAAALDVLQDVSREIDAHCARRFYADETATSRVYSVTSGAVLHIDDVWTVDDLQVNGVAWPAPGLVLHPRNGVVDGIEGWPYTSIHRAGGWAGEVTVTARWGWAQVPHPVRQSCLILAAETAKLSEAPFGVGGYGEFGIVKARDNPFAARKLGPYRLRPAVAL